MSNVLFAAAVAERSGTDVETASRVIAAASAQIRDMALAGSGISLTGVGRFDVSAPEPGSRSGCLTFTPVDRLTKIARGAAS